MTGGLQLSIRRGELADAPALATFAERCFVDTYGAENTPENLRAYVHSAFGAAHQFRELADAEMITLLAFDDDQLAGYVQVRRGPPPDCVVDRSAAEVFRLYVDQPYHGRGVAAPLMVAARASTAELGAGAIWLGVWEKNPRAIAFYIKAGFTDVGTHDFYVGEDRQTDRVLVGGV